MQLYQERDAHQQAAEKASTLEAHLVRASSVLLMGT